MSDYVWQPVHGVMTPGGDPCWRCPVCGMGEHVCGIETSYNHTNECCDCGVHLLYPHEKWWAEKEDRCTKCVSEVSCRANGVAFPEHRCEKYHRDASDGGY